MITGDELITSGNAYLNEISMEVFESMYNINWQLRLYLYTRLLEDTVQITQNKFENLYNESIKINKFSDSVNSLKFINQKKSEVNGLIYPKKILILFRLIVKEYITI